MPMTVKDHFIKVFPNHLFRDDEAQILESMILNSHCGADCRKAIDSVKPFLGHVKAAFGDHDNTLQHPKGNVIREEIAEAVFQVCACYICG